MFIAIASAWGLACSGDPTTLAEAMITRAVGLVSESLPEGGAGWLGQEIAEGLRMSQERAAVAADTAVTKKQFLLLHP